MKILVTTPTFLPTVGGAELGIHEIYRRIGRKHEVVVLTPTLLRADAPSRDQDRETSSYETFHLPGWVGRVRPRAVARALGRTSLPYASALIGFARGWRPDAINAHFIQRNSLVIEYFARRGRVPVLLSLVGRSDVVDALPPASRLIARRVVRDANAVVPNSSYYLHGSGLTGSAIIPYGVDIASFQTAASRAESLRTDLVPRPSSTVLLAVQRLVPVKRVDALLRVVAELRTRTVDVTLVIVGDGPEAPHLKDLAGSLDIGDSVLFTGYVSEQRLTEYFAVADAFVFHSMSETFGVVFAQAMAAGLPIVAADTSCVSHIVRPENGRLVAPFDVAGFAEAVMTLTGDRSLHRSVSARNRLRAEREFDWNRIAALYEAQLEALVAGRFPPPGTDVIDT